MHVLALDTATPAGSVALWSNGTLQGEFRLLSERGHSRQLLPAIELLLRSRDLEPVDLDGVGVCVGPGSFTGVRVGLSTAQGLGLAADLSCIGISRLDALARFGLPGVRTVAVMDAFRGECFAALYDAEGRLEEGPMAVVLPKLLLGLAAGRIAFVGDGATMWRDEIERRMEGACFPPYDPFLAGTMAAISAERLERGEACPAAALRPCYARGVDIHTPRP